MATRRMIKLDPEAEAKIASLAEEAEAGFAPEQIRSPRAGRPPMGEGLARVVQCRVEEDLFTALLDRARQEGIGISAVAREALEAFLRPDTPPLRDKSPVVALLTTDIAGVKGEGESRKMGLEELTSSLSDLLGPLSEEDVRMAERGLVMASQQTSKSAWLMFSMADVVPGERSLLAMLRIPYSSSPSHARDQRPDDPRRTITGISVP